MFENKNRYTLKIKEFKRLFNTQYTPLCLFSNKYVENIEISKDIVQDVFIKIWEDKIIFKNENNIKSFLYTAVRNKSLDFLKSKRHKMTNSFSDKNMEILESEPFFLREIVVLETSDIINNAIDTLPKKCAQIIRLSLKEYTNTDISKELGISINTIKTQKKIAYKRLRPLLKDSFLLIAFIFNS